MYSDSVEVLSGVSITAQSHTDKVHLTNQLHKELWNNYIFSKLIFQSLYL